MKKTLCSILVLMMVLALAQTASALSYTTYTDRTAWEGALIDGFFTETFDDATLHPYVSINSTYPSAGVSGGVWNDQVDNFAGYESSIDFLLPAYAFGADWNLAGPGGPGGGLDMDLAFYFPGIGPLTLTPALAGTTNGFWGIVVDNLFTSVAITDSDPGGTLETFNIDNLSWAHVPGTNPVPIPGAVWLLGSGLFGLIGARNRNRFMKK